MTNYSTADRQLMGATRVALCCWVFAILAGGCGGPIGPSGPMVQIDSTAEFNSTVLGSRKPVMTMFYKEGCPACAVTEAVMGQLSAEYHGQVVFAKYPLANPLSIVKNRELRDKYNLVVWPTVILFFDGNERKRWTTNDFPAQEYENSIKEVLSIRRD